MPTPRYNELSTGQFTLTSPLTDENDDALPGASLLTLTLTIRDIDTKEIINHRDSDDILVSSTDPVSALGVLSIQLEPGDNQIITPRRQVERHELFFQYTWADGERYVRQEIEVRNLHGVAGSPS